MTTTIDRMISRVGVVLAFLTIMLSLSDLSNMVLYISISLFPLLPAARLLFNEARDPWMRRFKLMNVATCLLVTPMITAFLMVGGDEVGKLFLLYRTGFLLLIYPPSCWSTLKRARFSSSGGVRRIAQY